MRVRQLPGKQLPGEALGPASAGVELSACPHPPPGHPHWGSGAKGGRSSRETTQPPRCHVHAAPVAAAAGWGGGETGWDPEEMPSQGVTCDGSAGATRSARCRAGSFRTLRSTGVALRTTPCYRGEREACTC